jgi:hypothetical protein
VDKVLAVVAAVVALAAVASTVYIYLLELPGTPSGGTPSGGKAEKAAVSTIHVASLDGPR